MAQAKIPPSSSFFATWVAGVGFGLAGLLAWPAAGDAIQPALPDAAASGIHQPDDRAARPAIPEKSLASPETGKSSEKATDGKTLPFEFSLAGDPEARNSQTFLLKLKRQAAASWPVGEALVWWTLPGGRKISLPLKQVSDDVWASRVALEKPTGRNGLAVMVLGDAGGGRLAQTLELDYEAELPGGALKFLGQGELAKKGADDAVEAKAEPNAGALVLTDWLKKEKPVWSLQTVAILVGLANVALLFPVLLLARILRRFLGGTDPDGEAARLLYAEIFSDAGLIEGAGAGEPLPEDPERTEPATGAAKPLSKEMFEATMLEPPAAPSPQASRPIKAAAEKDRGKKKEGGPKNATMSEGDEPPKVDLADLSF